MRILGLTDLMGTEDLMAAGIKKAFPKAEVHYLGWPPSTGAILAKENLQIEKNGAKAGMPIPGIIEAVRDLIPRL